MQTWRAWEWTSKTTSSSRKIKCWLWKIVDMDLYLFISCNLSRCITVLMCFFSLSWHACLNATVRWDHSLISDLTLSTNSSRLENSSGSTWDKAPTSAPTTVPSASIDLHQLAMMEDRMYAPFLCHSSYLVFLPLLLALRVSLLVQNFNLFLLYCRLSYWDLDQT